MEPRSILLIRLSAIGDVVMASPIIKVMRERYPKAYIAWLAQPEVAPLLRENPNLDDIIVFPSNIWGELWRGKNGLKLGRELVQFIRQLRYERFDLAIDLQGLMKSAIWAWLSGASNRIGLQSREGSGFFATEILFKQDLSRKIGAEYRTLAYHLGGRVNDFDIDVVLTENDRQSARRRISSVGERCGYAVICPFTTRPQKHWRDEYWRNLISTLKERYSLEVLILGGPGDRQNAEALAAEFDSSVRSVAGKTTLREAAALIEKSTVLIGVDTGLTHLGTGYGVPTVALFGSTCPYLDGDRSTTIVLYKALPCSPCRRKPTCNKEYSCMRALLPQDVIIAIERLLGSSRSLINQ